MRNKMSNIYTRVMFLEMGKPQRDVRECVEQAVKELVSEEELSRTYTTFGIDYNEYIDDMCKAYFRYKKHNDC